MKRISIERIAEILKGFPIDWLGQFPKLAKLSRYYNDEFEVSRAVKYSFRLQTDFQSYCHAIGSEHHGKQAAKPVVKWSSMLQFQNKFQLFGAWTKYLFLDFFKHLKCFVITMVSTKKLKRDYFPSFLKETAFEALLARLSFEIQIVLWYHPKRHAQILRPGRTLPFEDLCYNGFNRRSKYRDGMHHAADKQVFTTIWWCLWMKTLRCTQMYDEYVPRQLL